mgnify:CR=1 FL=1
MRNVLAVTLIALAALAVHATLPRTRGQAAFAEESDAHPTDRAAESLFALVPLVEAACGGTFDKPPVVSVVDADTAARAFAADLAPTIERRYASIPEAARGRLLAQKARASVASTLARYSVGTRSILIVRDAFDSQRQALGFAEDRADELLRAVLAHECVHALDDQRFDLATLLSSAPDEEALKARAMIVEGRAVVFGRRAATAAKLPRDVVDLLPGGARPEGAPAFVARLTYELGAQRVQRALDQGGSAAAKALLRVPPSTTHEVCRPPSGDRTESPAEDGDAVARAVLAAAGLTSAEVLSALELRARYAALHDRETSDRLFARFRGGAQQLDGTVNLAVLSFDDDEAATLFAERSAEETATQRVGTMVVRAAGEDADTRCDALAAAARRVRDAR